MTIEIATECMKSNILYEEAQMYCFMLEHNGTRGWRLPTEREYDVYPEIWGWYQDDDRRYQGHRYRVTPVRDIEL